MAPGAVHGLVGFLVQPPGIQSEHGERFANFGCHIDQHHILQSEAGRNSRLGAKLFQCPLQNFLWGFRFKTAVIHQIYPFQCAKRRFQEDFYPFTKYYTTLTGVQGVESLFINK